MGVWENGSAGFGLSLNLCVFFVNCSNLWPLSIQCPNGNGKELEPVVLVVIWPSGVGIELVLMRMLRFSTLGNRNFDFQIKPSLYHMAMWLKNQRSCLVCHFGCYLRRSRWALAQFRLQAQEYLMSFCIMQDCVGTLLGSILVVISIVEGPSWGTFWNRMCCMKSLSVDICGSTFFYTGIES